MFEYYGWKDVAISRTVTLIHGGGYVVKEYCGALCNRFYCNGHICNGYIKRVGLGFQLCDGL